MTDAPSTPSIADKAKSVRDSMEDRYRAARDSAGKAIGATRKAANDAAHRAVERAEQVEVNPA
ncbi:MAG: hypothetical protein M3R41_09150, partial [Pseudomonadota bacterium]|nr:hypothetical protein [Pseudomonadota bacterium]